MHYRAKVDWWIALCLCLPLVLPLLDWLNGGGRSQWVVPAVMLAVLFTVCIPQWYETGGDALVVRTGLITRRIPYREITAVRANSEGRSSQALSLDRIEIEYGNRRIQIAPREQEAFFADIAARAPQLSKRGQDLVASMF